jgi:hypothetical protein
VTPGTVCGIQPRNKWKNDEVGERESPFKAVHTKPYKPLVLQVVLSEGLLAEHNALHLM